MVKNQISGSKSLSVKEKKERVKQLSLHSTHSFLSFPLCISDTNLPSCQFVAALSPQDCRSFPRTGIRQFLCRACSYHAVTQSDLSRHEKTRQHLVRQQNACSSCGLGFNSPALLGDHALSCGAVRDLTSKVQSTTEANNNDRSFESRNGESLPARPRPLAEDSAGHSSSGGGSRLEKSCVLLKKKLLCFEGAL